MKMTYTDLMKLKNYQERFKYLKLDGLVSELTFGGHRYLNQRLYHSNEWKRARRSVIIRDNGFDLGDPDCPIVGKIYIHHINPITIDDLVNWRPLIFDSENLISVSFETHNAIHYGCEPLHSETVTRRPYDTCPWR